MMEVLASPLYLIRGSVIWSDILLELVTIDGQGCFHWPERL